MSTYRSAQFRHRCNDARTKIPGNSNRCLDASSSRILPSVLKFHMPNKKNEAREFFRVTITYSDDEVSGKVFGTREQAEPYATRQKKSPVVKRAEIEPFIKDPNEWRKTHKFIGPTSLPRKLL